MTTSLCTQLQDWHTRLTPVVEILKRLASTTEDQFLQLGERLQDFALRSSQISTSATELAQLVAGDESSQLTSRLRHLFDDMESYLQHVRSQGDKSCHILEQIMSQLELVVQPLEGFQKMDKSLRMLSISTKIESARLGELGAGFTTLALDVEKLSHTVSEKSAGIMAQRLSLSTLITDNLETVRSTEASHHADASAILAGIHTSLETLTQLNASCSTVGAQASIVSEEVSADTGTVVASMQFHDITRQQIEHIIEALEKLRQHTCNQPDTADRSACTPQIATVGDVCELQHAQLRHAISQLHQATQTILESLQNIGIKQSQISDMLQQALLGNARSLENTLLNTMQQDMQRVTAILQRCADADLSLEQAMQQVTGTISQIAGFVSDIESVGAEIDLIALNAQIKAAHTGPQGAALGVLAEAIKRLSLEAVVQTEAVSQTLRAISDATAHLTHHDSQSETTAADQVTVLKDEANQIITALSRANRLLHERLTRLADMVTSLSADINATTSGFTVHHDIRALAEQAESALEQIYTEARGLVPASSEFRNNLRHMEQRYTMESERLIHEMLAARHGVHLSLKSETAAGSSGSEFGDNVDLF